MKKLLAILLSLIMTMSVMQTGFSVLAAEIPDSGNKQLEQFTEDVMDLIHNNGSVFSVRSESYRHRALAEARVIVKSSKKIDTLNAVKTVEGYNDLHILQFEDKEAADKALAYYETLDYVEYAQKDCISSVDDAETEKASVNAVANPMADKSESVGINALRNYIKANNIKYEDEIIVAILDTGIESTHELLEGRIVPNDFNSVGGNSAEDDEGHGTHVAGIVVANSLDNVKIKPYKVANSEGDCTDLEVMLGIEAAIEDGVDVINMSLGRLGRCDLWYDSVKKAYDKNIPVCVSAGNKSANLSLTYYSPASFEECITVMACNSDMMSKPDFTNYGGATDIAAPGNTINSSSLGNSYVNLAGTSMACPFVTAAVTYLLLNNKNITCAEIEAKIKGCSVPFLYYAPDINSSVLQSGETGVLYAEYLTRDIRKASAPVFSVDSCDFSEIFSVSVSGNAQEGTSVYYRTSLMTDKAYKKYTGPITVKYDMTVTAFAAKRGLITSEPVSVTYTRAYPTEDSKYLINEKGEITEYIGKDTQLVIPETVKGITVKGIASGAFRKSNITSVILPETTEYILPGAFDGCLTLEHIRMNSVTRANGAFMGCTNLKFVECKSLETIGASCFKNCKNLQNFDFSNVKVIEENAFEGAGGIYSVISDSITEIKESAFRDSSVAVVDLPNATTIKGSAFYNCRNLESVRLPSITELRDKIFFNCSALKSFEADNLLTVAASVFSGCKAIKSFVFPNLKTTENIVGSAGYVFSNCISLESFEAPELTDLSSGCFSGCASLKSLSLPSVTSVGNFAVQNCTAIEDISLPALKSVNLNVFYGCSSLKELELPNLIETVYNNSQFSVMSTDFLILDKAEKIHSFPNNAGVLLPSTVNEIDAPIPENLTVYASRGTYAYNWAVENSVPVKEITKETALVNDLPLVFSPENSILTADIIGFNRTYQWYGTDIADNTSGEPVSGAVQRKFDTSSSPKNYKFYYCVVTSRDIGNLPVEIRTGLSADSTLVADYSAVRAEIAKIPEDLTLYTDESVGNLQNILDSIDYSLTIAQQETVDGYALAVSEAVAALEYRPADYTAYNEAVARAGTIDRSHYARDELTDLDNALAVDVSGKLITEQAQVDAQTKKINDALDVLVIGYADYTEYNKVVAEANSLDKNLYKDTSALTAALRVNVRNLLATQQHIVDAYTKKIRDAIDALEYKDASYTQYNKAVASANALDRSLYVDLTALDGALAVDVSGKLIIEQDAVDAQTQAILDAIDALQYKPADYTEYNRAVENAQAVDRNSGYDLTELDEALAVDVSGCNITEQDIVDAQTQAILTAIENLGKSFADYTEYNDAVRQANALDRSLYVDLTALDSALAVDVSGKDITEQETVDAQAQAILDAIAALQYKPADYTEYNKAVEAANALDRSLYEDLTALDNVLAVDVSGKLINEQSVVDNQTKAIRDAIATLRYIPADFTEYNKAVEEANALDRSLYKDLTALDRALAVDVSSKNISEQAIVDAQTKKIRDAIAALQYKPADYSAYNHAVKVIEHLNRDLYVDLTAVDELLAVDISGKDITEQYIVDEHTQAILDAKNALEYKPADFTYYNEAVEAANALDRSLYTDLTALDAALAIDVSGYKINKQHMVDDAENAILDAIDALQLKSADFTEYDKAVAKANGIDREAVGDLTALDNALAVDVSGCDITQQSLVDAQTKAILDAIDALEYKHADYSEYVKAVSKANKIDRSLYTNADILDALLREDVSDKNISEQAVVDAQTKAILDAIDALEYKPADYAEYNKAVEAAGALDFSIYKDTSALTDALSVDVSGKNITEQAIVDAQTKAILDAIKMLEIKPADYYEYVRAISKANKINRSLYKDTTALDALLFEDVSDKNITEQAIVDAQTKAILDAIDALEYKSADYSAVQQAKAKIPADLSEYTEESVNALNAVLESVDYSLNITQQDAVDAKANEILEAINALESAFVYGDADFDGVTGAYDYEMLKNYICGAEQLSESQLAALDLDNDGTVDGIDLFLLDLYINTGKIAF